MTSRPLTPAERDAIDGLRAAGPVIPIFEPNSWEKHTETSGHDLVAFGSDSGTTLALDLEDRSVVSVNADSGQWRLVNSSLAAFVDSLDLLRRFWAEHGRESDDAYLAAARHLRPRMTAVDRDALSSGDTWWSLVIEQVENGLL